MKININYDVKNKYIFAAAIFLILFFCGRLFLCGFAKNYEYRDFAFYSAVNLAFGLEENNKDGFINTTLNKLISADAKYVDPITFEQLKSNLNKVSPNGYNPTTEYCNC